MPGDIHVLLIDLSKRYGGASARTLTLARNLGSETAIAGLQDSPVIKTAMERKIPVKIVGNSRVDPCIPFRLKKVISNGGFQIIDTQNIQAKFWGSLAALITDAAFVATLNSDYRNEQGKGWKGKFYALLDHWTNFRTDRFIAVSGPILKDLLKAGIPEERIDLITNAVEIDSQVESEDPKVFRRQIGLPENALLCFSVGRLVWAKGYEDFITAFKSAAERLPNAYALVAGEGMLHQALSEQIKAAGLENRFILLGYCEDKKIQRLLKAGDIFIQASRSEGVPLALLEAAAAGKPIISTRCGGVPDIFTDNVEALLVPVGDSSAMAEGIIKLALDQQMALRLGEAGREKIRRNHNAQAHAEAIKCSYTKALAHKKGVSI